MLLREVWQSREAMPKGGCGQSQINQIPRKKALRDAMGSQATILCIPGYVHTEGFGGLNARLSPAGSSSTSTTTSTC